MKSGEQVLFIFCSQGNVEVPLALSLREWFERRLKREVLDMNLLKLIEVPPDALGEIVSSCLNNWHIFVDELRPSDYDQSLSWVRNINAKCLTKNVWMALDVVESFLPLPSVPTRHLSMCFRKERGKGRESSRRLNVTFLSPSYSMPQGAVETIHHVGLESNDGLRRAVAEAVLRASNKVSRTFWVMDGRTVPFL